MYCGRSTLILGGTDPLTLGWRGGETGRALEYYNQQVVGSTPGKAA